MFVFDPRAATGLIALVLLPTCARAPELPETPDVSRQLSAYAAPGGTIDTSQPASWLAAADEQMNRLGGGAADVVIARTVASAFVRLDNAALPTGHDGPVPAHIDGVVTFVVPCGAAANEIANVSVAIVDGTISRVIWGTAHACPFWQGVGAQAAYDGPFTMYRYPGVDLFVALAGTISDSASPASLDFRVFGGRIETRVATETGDVIAARDGADIVVRAANGTFRCNRKERTCR
jgi:hypothetical protein